MKLKEIQHIFHQELDPIYGKDEVDSFFYLLTDEYLAMSRLAFALQPEFVITKEEEQPLFEALSALKLEKPIQHILGKTEFFGLPFHVSGHTLIPRPETEELVQWIIDDNSEKIKENKTLKILDIGTGTGCIAIALAKNLKNSEVFAIDINKDALKMASENASLNAVEIQFMELDILSQSDKLMVLDFDIVVSNPPYVRNSEKKEMQKNVLAHDPHLALFVSDDEPLLFYKAITLLSSRILKNGGHLYLEINQYLGKDMLQLLEDHNFTDVELKKDLFGNDRMIKGCWYHKKANL